MGTAGHRAPRPPAVHSLARQSPRSSPSLAGFLLLTGTSNFARDQLLDATSPASLAAPTACATVDDGCPGRKRAWTGVRDSESAMTTVVVECQADVCQKADHPGLGWTGCLTKHCGQHPVPRVFSPVPGRLACIYIIHATRTATLQILCAATWLTEH